MLYLSSKDGESCFIGDSESPEDVYPIFRLSSDLEALEFLLKGDDPTRIFCPVKKTGLVAYGIGDASYDGFGAAIHLDDDLQFRYGPWVTAISEKSFNY